MNSNANYQKIIEEYTPKYCYLLESIYGEGMMSEGGVDAIEQMFTGIDLKDKKALDIGCGLGGVSVYLEQKHQMDITGLEINPWMVEECTKKVPSSLQNKLRYLHVNEENLLPVQGQMHDIVYSKGVFTHIEHKDLLLEQIVKILKPNGNLVITDWISGKEGEFGPNIKKLQEIEDLTLFAHTKEHYEKLLKNSGFLEIFVRDDSEDYLKYNQTICNFLQKSPGKDSFEKLLGISDAKENLIGYQSIVSALQEKELFVLNFVAAI